MFLTFGEHFFCFMKISGFTFVRNAAKLYYPVKESIESVLPIVDEFVIALGSGDADDTTEDEILKINSDKIKIIKTVWDIEKFPNGTEHAHQSNIAKDACTGDWLIYVQADELIHEKDHPTIVNACKRYLNDSEVEGFLFDYYHFYGDYDRYNHMHGWYPKEIRVIRNRPDIYSFISAQSFRRIPNFDGLSYREKAGTFKLKVKAIDAHIYHYGWVRPPRLMQKKSRYFYTTHLGKEGMEAKYAESAPDWDYGNLSKLRPFDGTHPAVLQPFIDRFDWKDQLHYERHYTPDRPLWKHETLRNRVLTWFEQNLFNGKTLFGYSNWELLDD